MHTGDLVDFTMYDNFCRIVDGFVLVSLTNDTTNFCTAQLIVKQMLPVGVVCPKGFRCVASTEFQESSSTAWVAFREFYPGFGSVCARSPTVIHCL